MKTLGAKVERIKRGDDEYSQFNDEFHFKNYTTDQSATTLKDMTNEHHVLTQELMKECDEKGLDILTGLILFDVDAEQGGNLTLERDVDGEDLIKMIRESDTVLFSPTNCALLRKAFGKQSLDIESGGGLIRTNVGNQADYIHTVSYEVTDDVLIMSGVMNVDNYVGGKYVNA